MQTNAIPGRGISHYDITNVSLSEMDTLCSLANRADVVCKSMDNKEEKTEYFTKEECNMLRAVLKVLTRGCSATNNNDFLNFLKEEKEKKEEKNPQPQICD